MNNIGVALLKLRNISCAYIDNIILNEGLRCEALNKIQIMVSEACRPDLIKLRTDYKAWIIDLKGSKSLT